MNRPLMSLSLIYIAGILTAPFLKFPALLLALAGFVLLVMGCILQFIRKPWVTELIVALCFTAGLLTWQSWQEQNLTPLLDYAGRYVTLNGVVIDEPRHDEGRLTCNLQVQIEGSSNQGRPLGTVVMTVKGNQNLVYGDTIRVEGFLSRPAEPANPGQFNYRKYLERRGIYLTFKAEGKVEILGQNVFNPVKSSLYKLKRTLIAVNAKTLDRDEAAVVNGMLFGTREGINRDIQEVFSETGLVHILSVSGMHLALVVFAVAAILGPLPLPGRSKFIITAVILLGYCLITGFQPPVFRAFIMAIMVLGAKELNREGDWPTSLCLAAALILYFSPGAVFDAGFQLSFAATWGILYLVPVLEDYLRFLPAVLRPYLSVPLAAQLATAPLVAFHFNMVSLVSIPANIILIELSGLIIYLGLTASLSGLLWLPLAGVLNVSQGMLVSLFIWSARVLGDLPGGTLYLKAPSLWFIILWYIVLIVIPQALQYGLVQFKLRRIWQDFRKPLIYLTLCGSLALVSFWRPAQNLNITYFDVGEADSALVRTPGGQTLLIDTGRGSEGHGGPDRLVPALKSMGVNTLDVLVVTHGDIDHSGGAKDILKKFDVKMLVIPPGMVGEPHNKPLLQLARKEGTVCQAAEEGDNLRLEPGINAMIINPQKKLTGETQADSNNSSLVLKLTYDKRAFLFTADIEEEAIRQILEQNWDLRADILKVAHHGSISSLNEEFYNRVHPQVAVISVGQNRYGHPSPKVIRGLAAAGVRTLRTDRSGAITVSTDGTNLQVKAGRDSF